MKLCFLCALILLIFRYAYTGFNCILDTALDFLNNPNYKNALKLAAKVLKSALSLSFLLLACVCIQTGAIFGYELSEIVNLTIVIIAVLLIFTMLIQINLTFYRLFKTGVDRVMSTVCLILNTGFGLTIIPYAVNLISTFILKRG